jgi:hypothetical protein
MKESILIKLFYNRHELFIWKTFDVVLKINSHAYLGGSMFGRPISETNQMTMGLQIDLRMNFSLPQGQL